MYGGTEHYIRLHLAQERDLRLKSFGALDERAGGVDLLGANSPTVATWKKVFRKGHQVARLATGR